MKTQEDNPANTEKRGKKGQEDDILYSRTSVAYNYVRQQMLSSSLVSLFSTIFL